MERGRLSGLDALRGIAALMVLAYHASDVFGYHTFPHGYLVVDFFFMLSGYVIARMREGRSDGSLAFAWMRYKRFFPVMAVGTAIGLAVHPFNPVVVAAGFLILPWLTGARLFPYNNPAWSIFFELFANAAHAAVPRTLWALVCLASVGAYIALGQLGSGSTPESFWGGFPRVLIAYSIGVQLFYHFRDVPPVRLPGHLAPILLFVSFLPPVSFFFDLAFVMLVCPVIIFAGLNFSPRWAKASGALSFPLYAVHLPLLELAQPLGLAAAVASALAGAGLLAWGMTAKRLGRIARMHTEQDDLLDKVG